MTTTTDRVEKLGRGLAHPNTAVRLRAALAAGTHPQGEFIELLLERCGVEPDFYVRDMLTWALIHQPRAEVVPQLRVDLGSSYAQARGQALHTLSKIGDPQAWDWITLDHIHDPDDVVAVPAWRVAVAVAPDDRLQWLATELLKELGRSDHDTMRSLARAIVAIGDRAAAWDDETGVCVIEPMLEAAIARTEDPKVLAHAEATLHLHRNPGTSFSLTQSEAIDVEFDSHLANPEA